MIFAGLFSGVGRDRMERKKDYISLLFFFVAHWSFHPVFKAIGSYPRQRDVLTRERASDSYPISAWFIADVLGEWAVMWAHPLVFYVVAWPIACMPLAMAPQLYLITMLNYEVFLSLGNLVAAAVFDADRARIVVVVVMVFNMLAGGFFIDLNGPWVPLWISKLHHVSYQTYTFGLYVRNALTVDDYAGFDEMLHNYSFSNVRTSTNVGILIAFGLVWRLSSYMIVLHSKKLRFS